MVFSTPKAISAPSTCKPWASVRFRNTVVPQADDSQPVNRSRSVPDPDSAPDKSSACKAESRFCLAGWLYRAKGTAIASAKG